MMTADLLLILLAAAVIAVLGLGAWVVLLRARLTAARAEARQLDDQAGRAAALLAAMPGAYLFWPLPGAAVECSAGAKAFFGADTAPADLVAALASRLTTPDRAAFETALDALLDRGAPFSISTGGADGDAAWRLVGAPAGAGRVLWLFDRAAERDALARLTHERDSLRALIDCLPLPVWRRAADLRLDYVNDAYWAAVDSGGNGDARMAPEIAAGVLGGDGRALAARARAAGAPARETRHLVMGGKRRWVDIAEAPLAQGDLAGYALDRTDVEEAQSELTRHVEAHDEVLHQLGTAIAIYGPDQRLLFFNTAFVRLWGLEEFWLRTQPTHDEVLEALRERRRLPEQTNFPAYKEEARRLFTSLIAQDEQLIHLPDETTLRLVVTPHPFGGLLFTWEDVTDKLALERSYNTLIAVQRETLDHLHEGIAVIGSDGRLKLSNPAFAQIWQTGPEELKGETHVSNLVERMRPFFGGEEEWEARREELIARLDDREPLRGRLERVDGTVLDYSSIPLPDGAVLLSYVDVSDSINMERALRERNEALETADQLKSEFIANVSYELRTPLNTIIGFAEILHDQYFGLLNPRQMEYSRGILESSQRLLSLINDILDLATIEAGHMSLELDTIDLHALLASVLSLVRERARKKKLQIEFDCPTDIGLLVADERRLKQALFNILNNSVKFTPVSGAITVTARRGTDEMVLTFTDTGIGIPDQDRVRVFGKFERGSSPEARNAGVGLGLSLVKSFIELHGGRIDLDSQAGNGTRVTCYLPARQADSAQPRDHAI